MSHMGITVMNANFGARADKAVSPVIAVVMLVAITVVIAAVVAAFAYGIIGGYKSEPSYSIIVAQNMDNDYLRIKAFDTSNRPLSNVIVAVYEHGEERLISGPQMTDESGYCTIAVPEGYNECFDIVAEYENEIRTLTVDKRPILVKVGDKLGDLGIAVISALVGAIVGGVIGWFIRDSKEATK
jgi:flagellin-like protein